MKIIIFIIIVFAVGYFVYSEYNKSKKAKQQMFDNGKPGYLSIYRSYSDKGRDIEVLVNGESKGILNMNDARTIHIKLDGPSVVTTTLPGKYKSSFEITSDELSLPVFAKVTGSKYSNDIVKINQNN